jgi:DNA-directed RNA polymerase specialized sigma24 family protein
LTIALTKDIGDIPDFEELGKRMGVNKGTAKTFLDRAFQKIKKEHMQHEL